MRALVYLAGKFENTIVPARKIARDLNIPKEFVSKILQSLVGKGYVGSRKGKNGGFYLSSDPSEIKLESIFKVLGYSKFKEECFLGLSLLCDNTLCDLCSKNNELKIEFDKTIKTVNIKSLSEVINREGEKNL